MLISNILKSTFKLRCPIRTNGFHTPNRFPVRKEGPQDLTNPALACKKVNRYLEQASLKTIASCLPLGATISIILLKLTKTCPRFLNDRQDVLCGIGARISFKVEHPSHGQKVPVRLMPMSFALAFVCWHSHDCKMNGTHFNWPPWDQIRRVQEWLVFPPHEVDCRLCYVSCKFSKHPSASCPQK